MRELSEININGLHVGDLGQGGVDGVDEGGHGEDSGDPQSYSGWSCSSVEPEGDPGHHHYKTARNINLEEICYNSITMASIEKV